MSFVFVGLELSERALFLLRKLRRPLPDVLWFDPLDDGELLAPLRRSWFEEWGYLPLACASCDEADADLLDRELQRVRLPAVSFRISRLTFLADPEPFQVCARVDVSPGLQRLIDACVKAVHDVGATNLEPGFAPLLPLASCHGASREHLTAYSNAVEPFEPITVRCDRFVLCSKSATSSLQARVTVDYEYRLG